MGISILFVGLGGALGAMARYGIGLIPVPTDFPILTLLINFCGAVLIGFLAQSAEAGGVSGNMLSFWKTGVCGGFTTFSAFSLESMDLFQKGAYVSGVLYVLCSVFGCMLGVFLGRTIRKQFG